MRPLRHLVTALALAGSLTTPALAVVPDASPAPVPASAAPAGATPDAALILDTARGKVAAGNTKGAIDGLAPYVAAHPGDTAAGRLLGDLYFRVPDFARAEKVWKAIVSLSPDDRETHSRLGSLYAVQDRVNDAILEFQKSLPSRSGYAGLVMIHKRAGDLQQYLGNLQYATEKAPFEAGAWTELGQARRSLRQYDAALVAFTRVVGIRPGSCSARVDLANVLVDLRRVDPAIVHLKACLQNDAFFYPAVVNLGEAYLEKGDATTARPYLDRALALRAEGTEALVDIGYVYDMQGDWKTAIVYYNRAIRSDPMRPEAYIDLGYDYNEHRLFPLAEAAFIKGISVAADDGRLHYLLAVTYNLQGKIRLARVEYQRAIASEEPDVARAAQAELALLPPS
ncbi:MAG: Flp pilus assembly protein TadD [Candidatus Eremiobacteraeota bacterium]|nr:Flp pilus assembly protein TadD [Candidatus Eremiobacteraeota bacterium]